MAWSSGPVHTFFLTSSSIQVSSLSNTMIGALLSTLIRFPPPSYRALKELAKIVCELYHRLVSSINKKLRGVWSAREGWNAKIWKEAKTANKVQSLFASLTVHFIENIIAWLSSISCILVWQELVLFVS